VKTFQSAQKLGSVEACAVDVESLLLLKVMEQFTSIYTGKDQIQLLGRLEGEFERDDERIVDLC
jgi:hypothetical protein